MAYIDRSLGEGETVIARAQFHWLYTLGAWLALVIPAALLLTVYLWSPQQPADSVNAALMIVAGVLFLCGFIVFLRMMIRKWTTEIGITSHRFAEKHGMIGMRTNEIAMQNIEGLRVHQSILGRIFNYGTIRIEGTGVDAVTTPTIADPVGFVRAIQTARERTLQRASQPGPAPVPQGK